MDQDGKAMNELEAKVRELCDAAEMAFLPLPSIATVLNTLAAEYEDRDLQQG